MGPPINGILPYHSAMVIALDHRGMLSCSDREAVFRVFAASLTSLASNFWPGFVVTASTGSPAISPNSHVSLIILNRVTSIGFARRPAAFCLYAFMCGLTRCCSRSSMLFQFS